MKFNRINTVEQGRTQCVKVEVRGIMFKNAVERSPSQIEVIRNLTKVGGTRYNVFLFKMGVVVLEIDSRLYEFSLSSPVGAVGGSRR